MPRVQFPVKEILRSRKTSSAGHVRWICKLGPDRRCIG